MSFNGSLIKIGSAVFPLKYVFRESYTVIPNCRQESDSFLDANGYLNRNILNHMPSKITFTTRPMDHIQAAEMMKLIRDNYINVNEKKVLLEYYCPDLDDYQSGTFYVPDVEFPIARIDRKNNRIYYSPFTLEFIEY